MVLGSVAGSPAHHHGWSAAAMVMRLVLLALAGRRPVALVLAQGTALGQRPEVALPRVLELALGQLLEGLNCLG